MKGCPKCVVTTGDDGREHHDPQCPEMFWPDGRPRGELQASARLPLPPFIRDPEKRKRFRIEHPGGWSPIADEMKGIFASVSPRVANTEESDVENP